MSGYKWIRGDVRQGVPRSAVVGGHDRNGSTIYIGRALHEGDLIPAKVIPSENKAYVPHNGKAHLKYNGEILVQTGGTFSWRLASNGYAPPDAVVGGHTSTGEALYIGRIDYQGSQIVGKILPSSRRLHIPYDDEEVSFYTYEVLAHN